MRTRPGSGSDRTCSLGALRQGMSFAFSRRCASAGSSGKTLAYAGSSGPKVVICSAPDGKPLRTLEHDAKIRGKLGLAPAVNALAFSPDGSLLATCEGTGDLARIELFSVSEGQLLKTLDASRLPADPEAKSDSPLELRDIHFSRDGKYLAWCGSRGVTVARVADLIG